MTQAVAVDPLRSDLDQIESAIDQSAIVDPAVRFMFKELVEWNRAAVHRVSDLSERTFSLEAGMDELLQGVEEIISPETAQIFKMAFEKSRLVCATLMALVDQENSPFDELNKKRVALLLRDCKDSIQIASQTISEIVMEEDEDGDDGAADGRGDGSGSDDDGDGDGGDGDDSDEDEEEVNAEDEG
jgi:hypothetical protein